MRPALATAELYINDINVGDVRIHGWESSWGFGDFQPNPGFAQFAPIFGRWSILMHADEDQRSLSEAASEELSLAECAIDALRCRLFFPQIRESHDVAQINIDGQLIEWKRR